MANEKYKFMGFGQPAKKIEEKANYAVSDDGKLLDFQRIESESEEKIRWNIRESKLAKKVGMTVLGIASLAAVYLIGSSPRSTEQMNAQYRGPVPNSGLKELILKSNGTIYEVANNLSEKDFKNLKSGDWYLFDVETPWLNPILDREATSAYKSKQVK